MDTDNLATLDAAIAALGLTCVIEFVPLSKSRNAPKGGRPSKTSDLSVNWRVTLSKGGTKLTTDYMEGIARLPAELNPLKLSRTSDEWLVLVDACETGKAGRLIPSGYIANKKPLPVPELRDVLYCLVQDSEVLDYATFEDWAAGGGYDTDSRTAERTYRACLEIALQLRALIGETGLSVLKKEFQDY
jgi:hypothetical protein